MFWFQRRGPASEQADLRDALLRRHGGQLWVGWKGWALRDLQRISRQQGNLSGRPLLLSKEQILLSISWANADILFVTECKLKYLKKSPYLDELFYFNVVYQQHKMFQKIKYFDQILILSISEDPAFSTGGAHFF